MMTDETDMRHAISGTLELAPPLTHGAILHLRGYLIPAPAVPQAVPFARDDTGMILSVCSVADASVQALGTGFVVAPGLAMTAAHVIADYLDAGRLVSGELLLIGGFEGALRAWQATAVKLPEDGDVALIEMVPRFDHGSEMTINHVELTARLPAVGEPVLAFGLIAQSDEFPIEQNGAGNIAIAVQGLAASGTALEFYPTRGRMMPGPVLRCNFRAPGGMSGGPVFDRDGRVFGIVTASMAVDDEWETYVSLPWSAFMFSVQPSWPPELYKKPGSLWPGHVADNWRIGLGDGEIAYFHDAPA